MIILRTKYQIYLIRTLTVCNKNLKNKKFSGKNNLLTFNILYSDQAKHLNTNNSTEYCFYTNLAPPPAKSI